MVSEEGGKRSEEQQVAPAVESNFLSFYHGEKGFSLGCDLKKIFFNAREKKYVF